MRGSLKFESGRWVDWMVEKTVAEMFRHDLWIEVLD